MTAWIYQEKGKIKVGVKILNIRSQELKKTKSNWEESYFRDDDMSSLEC